jgi:hypothetical protein
MSQHHRFSLNRRIAIALVGLAVLTVAGLELTNATHLLHKAPVATSGTIPTKQPDSQDKQAPAKNHTDDKDTVKTPTSQAPTASLVKPYGTFVSNHHPSLSGKSTPSQEASVCNTTPGASCKITLTKDGVTKTLAAQTTNSDGAAYWNWDVKQAGLTLGSWQITATASLRGSTSSATDPLMLEVQP